MTIGPYQIVHHTETVKAETWVVFISRNNRLERALHLGKRGGFKTKEQAIDEVTKTVRFGTTNV